MTKPDDVATCETLKDYPGIEFKAHGRQVVAPGSVHPDTLLSYAWDALAEPLSATREAPQALIDLLRRIDVVTATEAGDLAPEQLADMLSGLDPISYREHHRWLELMMACHHGTAGAGPASTSLSTGARATRITRVPTLISVIGGIAFGWSATVGA